MAWQYSWHISVYWFSIENTEDSCDVLYKAYTSSLLAYTLLFILFQIHQKKGKSSGYNFKLKSPEFRSFAPLIDSLKPKISLKPVVKVSWEKLCHLYLPALHLSTPPPTEQFYVIMNIITTADNTLSTCFLYNYFTSCVFCRWRKYYILLVKAACWLHTV